MAQTSAFAIVQNYHKAWTSSDIDLAMTWVADGITCRATGADLSGKKAYRQFIAGFAPALTGLADIASFHGRRPSRVVLLPADGGYRYGTGSGVLHRPGREDHLKRAHLRPPFLRPARQSMTEARR